MYSALIIPTFADDRRDEAMATIRDATAKLDTVTTLFAPTLPGVWNGGDAIWRVTFADAVACAAAFAGEAWAPAAALLDDPAVTRHTDTARFATGRIGGPEEGGGLYRVALFCADVAPSPDRLAGFAAHTASLARHVPTIRRWQLAEPDHATGSRRWTHVWEQEYADLAGLNGSYMLHPAHWAHAERWFDPEYPEWLVATTLVHTFCAIDRPVIAG